MKRFTKAVAAVASLVLVAACGSTVPQSLAGAANNSLANSLSGDSSLNLSPNPSGAADAGGQVTSGLGPALPSDASTSIGSGAPIASSSTTSGPVGSTPIASRNPSPIQIGIVYVDQSQGSTFTAAFGKGLATGDDKANYSIVIDAINARGGILGHKIEPIFYALSLSSTLATDEQAACVDFTQDHHVAFVMTAADMALSQCVSQAGGAAVSSDFGAFNSSDYAKLPYVLQPDAIPLDRVAQLQASEFNAMGLFKSSMPVKVGILFTDQPVYAAAEQVLKADLTKLGINVTDTVSIPPVESSSDVADAITADKAAALRFKAHGVTHVISVELNAWGIGFFGLNAAQQGYYPRYGYTSDQLPTNVGAVVPAKALQNSLVIGWIPAYDTADLTKYPAAALACLDLIRKNGQPLTSGNQRSQALTDCENIDYLAAALTKGGGVTRDALRLGARLLGTSYQSANTFAVSLPLGFGAGAAALRRGAFDSSCSCFVYTSAAFPIPSGS